MLVTSPIFVLNVSNFGIMYFKGLIFELHKNNFRFICTLRDFNVIYLVENYRRLEKYLSRYSCETANHKFITFASLWTFLILYFELLQSLKRIVLGLKLSDTVKKGDFLRVVISLP